MTDSTITALSAFVLVSIAFWCAAAIHGQIMRAQRAKEWERVRRRWEQILAVRAARARNAQPAPKVNDHPRRSER